MRARRDRRAARWGMRPLGVALALVSGVSLLTACSAVRNELGTTNGSCFVALPTAKSALGDHGELVGVRLFTVTSLRRSAPRLYEAAVSAPGPRITRVCLVAFHGHFRAYDVRLPVGDPSGHLAIVEIGYPGNRLLATLLLLRRMPLPFGHSHVGIL